MTTKKTIATKNNRVVRENSSDQDRKLVKRFVENGDVRALETLLRKHQDVIFRFGLRMCGQMQDAEDVVQETFLAAFRYLKQFRWEGSLRAWFLKLASSACLKKRRLRKGQPKAHLPLDNGATSVTGQLADIGYSRTPDAHVEIAELMEQLQRALLKLPPHYRAVIALRDFEGLSTEETASILGISPTATKVRLHRARARLTELVRRKI